MHTSTSALIITVGGLPAHPLLAHAAVVLLPLAALCAVAIAVLPGWRRRFGWPVLALTAAAVASVPVTARTGEELAGAQFTGSLPETVVRHQQLGEQLVPISLIFGAATALMVILGAVLDRSAAQQQDQEEEQTGPVGPRRGVEVIDATREVPAQAAPEQPQRRSPAERGLTLLVAAVVVASAVWTTAQVIQVGDSGARSVWGHVVQDRD